MTLPLPTPREIPPRADKPRHSNTELQRRYDVLQMVLGFNRDPDSALDLANWVLTGDDGSTDD